MACEKEPLLDIGRQAARYACLAVAERRTGGRILSSQYWIAGKEARAASASVGKDRSRRARPRYATSTISTLYVTSVILPSIMAAEHYFSADPSG